MQLLRSRILTAAVGAMGAGYLLQTISPLRLESDSVVYLYAASQFAEGRTPGVDVPLGYSFFLGVLDRVGVAGPFVFVLLNCAFLALGLVCLWQLAGKSYPVDRRWLLLLTLASVPLIHSIALALPEPAYLGISLLALLCMKDAEGVPIMNRVLLLLAAAALTAFAISLRNAGIALVPALLWSLFGKRVIADRRRLMILVPAIVVITAAVLVAALRTTAVTHSIVQAGVHFANGAEVRELPAKVIARIISSGELRQLPALFMTALTGIGELIVNLPYSRFRSLRLLYILFGAVGTAVFLVRMRPVRVPGPVGVYTIGYLLVLLLWPFPSPRLWMPIVPLLIAYAAPVAYRLSGSGRSLIVLRAYVCWFILTGAGALVYTSRLSLRRNDSKSLIERTPNYDVANGGVGNAVTFDQMLVIVSRRYSGEPQRRDGL